MCIGSNGPSTFLVVPYLSMNDLKMKYQWIKVDAVSLLLAS